MGKIVSLPTSISSLPRKLNLTREDLRKNLVYFFVGYFGMMAVLFLYGIFSLQKKIELSRQVKEEKINEYRYWVSVIEERPNYPDAYYNAALYAFELSNPIQAQSLLKKAIVLDPRFDEAIALQEKIEGRQ